LYLLFPKQHKKKQPKSKAAKPKQKQTSTAAPSRKRIKGHGDYSTMGGTLGSIAGGALGGPLGALVGKFAGSYLGSRIKGHGDYKINSNSLIAAGGIPTFGASITRISHAEYLGDVLGSTTYTATMYRFNPGDPTTCPWLRQVAANYQKYEIAGLVYEFRTTCGSAIASSNNALGVVGIATNYNVAEAIFSSKRTAESTMFVSTSVPSTSILHAVECAPADEVTKLKFIRPTVAIPENTDRALYDHANTTIFTEGMQTTTTIGELWISYDVILHNPMIPDPQGEDALSHHSWNNKAKPGNTPATNAAFGVAYPTISNQSTLTVDFYNDIVATPPPYAVSEYNGFTVRTPGTYLMLYVGYASGFTMANTWSSFDPGSRPGGATTILSYWGNGSTVAPARYPQAASNPGSSSGQILNAIVFTTKVINAGVRMSVGPTVTSGDSWDLVVMQISTGTIKALAPLFHRRPVVFSDTDAAASIMAEENEGAATIAEKAEIQRITAVLKQLGLTPKVMDDYCVVPHSETQDTLTDSKRR
jgi:hypothetical protein